MTGITENCRLLRRMKKYLVSHILTTKKKRSGEVIVHCAGLYSSSWFMALVFCSQFLLIRSCCMVVLTWSFCWECSLPFKDLIMHLRELEEQKKKLLWCRNGEFGRGTNRPECRNAPGNVTEAKSQERWKILKFWCQKWLHSNTH